MFKAVTMSRNTYCLIGYCQKVCVLILHFSIKCVLTCIHFDMNLPCAKISHQDQRIQNLNITS